MPLHSVMLLVRLSVKGIFYWLAQLANQLSVLNKTESGKLRTQFCIEQAYSLTYSLSKLVFCFLILMLASLALEKTVSVEFWGHRLEVGGHLGSVSEYGSSAGVGIQARIDI